MSLAILPGIASAGQPADGPLTAAEVGGTTGLAGMAGATRVDSPDRRTRVSVAVVDGRLRYSVTRRGEVVVGESGLGMDLQGRPSLTQDMAIESVERRAVDETWEPLWGADAEVRNHADELTVHAVQRGTGIRLDVIFRVFDDGVGFRYHFPAQAGLDEYTVTAEQTEFALDPASTSWSIAAGKDWNADEKHYREGALSTVATAQTPITLRTPGRAVRRPARSRSDRLSEHDAQGGGRCAGNREQ